MMMRYCFSVTCFFSYLTVVLGLDSQSDQLRPCPIISLYAEFDGMVMFCMINIV